VHEVVLLALVPEREPERRGDVLVEFRDQSAQTPVLDGFE
jgi:hypothetical protein